jgi:hypothetical protein
MIVIVMKRFIRLIDDLLIQLLNALHPYVLCDVFASLKQQKNVYHSPLLRKKMLLDISIGSRCVDSVGENLRFSPV